MVKVLMAVDGSEHDATTAAFLGKLFKGARDVQVVVLHVAHLQFPTPPAMEMGFVPVIPSAEEMERWETQIREGAQEILVKAEETVRQAGLANTTSQVAWGPAPDTILDIAGKEGVDMIALGSRGAGQVAGIFLGSVSDRVAHRANIPVLIVR
jgi:nucleotide-binding universal stress UspA family protein